MLNKSKQAENNLVFCQEKDLYVNNMNFPLSSNSSTLAIVEMSIIVEL